MDTQATRKCPTCGQAWTSSPPHTARDDFKHFLAYSGLAQEPAEVQAQLWKAFEHAWRPRIVEQLVVHVQGEPGEGEPSAVRFFDQHLAPVDFGPWEAADFNRWQLTIPLGPLVRAYVAASPPEG